jgi:hypothetical protein
MAIEQRRRRAVRHRQPAQSPTSLNEKGANDASEGPQEDLPLRRLQEHRQAPHDQAPAAAVVNATTTSTDHERALAWARAQVGRHEIPDGSNSGPFVELCQRATWLPGTGWPWCVAMFIAAWRHGADVILPWLGAGAYAFLDWATKNGSAVSLEHAIPGDAVILNIGAGHCAMLAQPYDGGTVVHTIDGNWSNSVETVAHPADAVRGCVHVHERFAVRRKIPPARPHVFEVATSATGHRKVVYVSGRRAIAGHIARLLNRFPRVTISPRGGTT